MTCPVGKQPRIDPHLLDGLLPTIFNRHIKDVFLEHRIRQPGILFNFGFQLTRRISSSLAWQVGSQYSWIANRGPREETGPTLEEVFGGDLPEHVQDMIEHMQEQLTDAVESGFDA